MITARTRPSVPGASRRVEIALGLLWVFDALLQMQPTMFSPEFFGMTLRMSPAEAPGWLWDVETRLEPWLTGHSVVANALCVAIQLGIGLGICCSRRRPFALWLSIGWGATVWLFGESAGGLFSPGASALIGAPGAAGLYAVVAWVLCVRRRQALRSTRPAGEGSWLDLVWVALFLGTAALEAGSDNLTPLVAGGQIYSAGNGEPGWLGTLNHWAGNLVGAHGVLFALCAGIVQALIGLSVLSPRLRRSSLAAGAALAMIYGIFGQDLGGILSNGLGILGSEATDPGTGPIVVLLACALWSAPSARSSARAPEPSAALATEGERDVVPRTPAHRSRPLVARRRASSAPVACAGA